MANERCLHRNGNLRMVYHVLNECLIDRGASPSMVKMDCYIDGHLVTNILVRSCFWDRGALLLSGLHGLQCA